MLNGVAEDVRRVPRSESIMRRSAEGVALAVGATSTGMQEIDRAVSEAAGATHAASFH
jgi:hypothetical protein